MSKRLPNRIIPLSNPDKEFHESWSGRRNLLNFPHPWRGVFLGPPNCGKGTVVKNLLLRAKPPFEEVVCIHCDPEYTKEWDDLGEIKMRADIPPPNEWPGEVKTLVIVDDLEVKGLAKEQKRNLDRLWGFVSTHKNISCCLLSQDAFNVPPIIRRCSNLWVLWRSPDLDSMACCARKSGMRPGDFQRIFSKFRGAHDSFWIDMTKRSPMPLRMNGFKKITRSCSKDTACLAEHSQSDDRASSPDPI